MSTAHSEAWDNFVTLCLEANNKEMLFLLFDLFLTPEEKGDLGARYQIIEALLKKEKTEIKQQQKKVKQAMNLGSFGFPGVIMQTPYNPSNLKTNAEKVTLV